MDQPPFELFEPGVTRTPSQGQAPPDPASHPSPNPWIATSPHTHVPPQRRWSPHPSPPPVPQFFSMHRPRHHPVSHPFSGHGGGLPLPDAGVRAYPMPEPLLPMPMPMPMHGRPWVHQFSQAPSPPVNGQPNPVNMNGATTDYPYGYPDASANGRGLTYQSAGEMGMGLAPLGSAAPEAYTSGRQLYPQHPEQLAANHMVAMPPLMPPYSPPTYIHQYSPHSTHVNHRPSLSASAAVPRMARTAGPHPTLFPPVSYHEAPTPHASNGDRRRSNTTRNRRSLNPRLPTADLSAAREGEEDPSHALRNHLAGRSGHRHSQTLNFSAMEEATVRQMQVIRAAIPQSKLVASRAALQSLQSVDLDQLPESDRFCVICYNDYGVETPEGVNEAPLQLPSCKHIFGDHCIKKWFEDSDSCPYCRDKLPSEPKNHVSSSRVYMNMMRLRGATMPHGLTDDVYMRIMAGLPADDELDEPVSRGPQAAERRSLPDDAGDGHRRIRPRRDSSEDYSHSEDDDAGALNSATSSAPVRIPSREQEQPHQWMSRSSGQRRAAQAALSQANGASQAALSQVNGAAHSTLSQFNGASGDEAMPRYET